MVLVNINAAEVSDGRVCCLWIQYKGQMAQPPLKSRNHSWAGQNSAYLCSREVARLAVTAHTLALLAASLNGTALPKLQLFAVWVVILSRKNILSQPECTEFDNVKGKGHRKLSDSTNDTEVHSLVVHLRYIKMSSQKYAEHVTVTRLLPNRFLTFPAVQLNTRKKEKAACWKISNTWLTWYSNRIQEENLKLELYVASTNWLLRGNRHCGSCRYISDWGLVLFFY